MKDYFCDMHIHIGATSEGRPVKITASKNLLFESIVTESLTRKGMDMIAVVDCAAPGVLRDIRAMITAGELYPHPDGGLIHRDRLAVIPASEIETTEETGGASHHICYFPDIRTISDFSRVMRQYITNIELSSQKARLTASQLFDVTRASGGVLVPAHAFTPHKSLYGNAGNSLSQIIDRGKNAVFAIELGLSADTDIADHLRELENVSFLSNSDAHSIPKIAREYNIIRMENLCFKEFILALHRRGGRKITANVGMDPKLGRYHRTFCIPCKKIQEAPPPVTQCRYCGATGKNIVRGVYDRIREIGDYTEPVHPEHRPPYKYQIPLEFIPGITEPVLKILLNHFGTEMAILNTVPESEIRRILPSEQARNLIEARSGKTNIDSGGGGRYGKVKKHPPASSQLSLNFD